MWNNCINKEPREGLFKSGPYHDKDHVVFNWHGQPIDEFRYFAEAYHKAAQSLVALYGASGAMRDFEAAPIIFLYRHALELYLKAFILEGSKLLKLANKEGANLRRILNGHRLSVFIPYFEAIIKECKWPWDMGTDGLRTKDDFVHLIEDIEEVDENSYAFRYPINKQGESVLPSHFSFKVSLVAKQLDALLDILDSGLMGIDANLDAAYEAADFGVQI